MIDYSRVAYMKKLITIIIVYIFHSQVKTTLQLNAYNFNQNNYCQWRHKQHFVKFSSPLECTFNDEISPLSPLKQKSRMIHQEKC